MRIVAHPVEHVLGTLSDAERVNAPAELFLLGDATLLWRRPRVAIVGSRQASAKGRSNAARYAWALARRGVVVVSGLAAGIDTAAHEAAIDGGGRTIAVLGTPLDAVYPRVNRLLQARIAREHLLVSQFPMGTSVRRRNFPARNRTMALLTDATIVVEATATSGSWHAAREALRLNRLLVLDASIDRSSGVAAELVERGAQVFASTDADRVADMLERSAVRVVEVVQLGEARYGAALCLLACTPKASSSASPSCTAPRISRGRRATTNGCSATGAQAEAHVEFAERLATFPVSARMA